MFDEWIKTDVGQIYVMNFEWALAACLRLPSGICLFSKDCGRALILEHNGDVYSCDHFMYPEYLLGNLQQTDFARLANFPQQIKFDASKSQALPNYCQQCEFLFACHGDCPKKRFAHTPDGANQA
ncbi:MAG: SPASM domain-containing protein [Methylobacter sp.]|nr:SPASM domain-containing protein [Methylobacter sp.]